MINKNFESRFNALKDLTKQTKPSSHEDDNACSAPLVANPKSYNQTTPRPPKNDTEKSANVMNKPKKALSGITNKTPVP